MESQKYIISFTRSNITNEDLDTFKKFGGETAYDDVYNLIVDSLYSSFSQLTKKIIKTDLKLDLLELHISKYDSLESFVNKKIDTKDFTFIVEYKFVVKPNLSSSFLKNNEYTVTYICTNDYKFQRISIK